MDTKLFGQLFPYSISFDEKLKIHSLGDNLKKVFPEIVVGQSLSQYFNLQLEPFTLKSKNLDLAFVGELIKEGEIYFLIGGIWPSNKKMNDFLEHQKRIDQVVNLSRDGLWELNLETEDYFFGPQSLGMLGYKEGDLKGRLSTWENLVKEEDLLLAEGILENHIRHGTPYEFKCRMKTKEGKWKWILIRGSLIERKKDGSPLRMLGTYSDIDHEMGVEQKLHLLHSRLIDGIGALESGFAIFDREEKLVVANSMYSTLFNLSKELLVPGVSIEKVLRAIHNDDAWVAREIAHFRDPGPEREDPFGQKWLRHVEKKTSERGVVSLVIDITKRKVAEEELKRARRREIDVGYRIQKTPFSGI